VLVQHESGLLNYLPKKPQHDCSQKNTRVFFSYLRQIKNNYAPKTVEVRKVGLENFKAIISYYR